MTGGGAIRCDASASRQRVAHQRRRIVEQHDHRAFGGGAIVGGQIGVEIGARQRAGGLGTLAGGRGTDPLQELTNDHGSTDATRTRTSNCGALRTISLARAALNKGFTINLWNC